MLDPVTFPCYHSCCQRCLKRGFKAEDTKCWSCRTDLDAKYVEGIRPPLQSFVKSIKKNEDFKKIVKYLACHWIAVCHENSVKSSNYCLHMHCKCKRNRRDFIEKFRQIKVRHKASFKTSIFRQLFVSKLTLTSQISFSLIFHVIEHKKG